MLRIGLASGLAAVLGSSAHAEVFTLEDVRIGDSDAGVRDPFGESRATDLIVIERVQETAGAIEGVSWQIMYTARDAPPLATPSWGSELRIQVIDPHMRRLDFDGSDDNGGGTGRTDADGQFPGSGAYPGVQPNDVTFGWGNAPGEFQSTGESGKLNGMESLGTWTFLIWDEFDNAGGFDGELDIRFTIDKEIPTPGAIVILAVGGLAARRNRRARHASKGV